MKTVKVEFLKFEEFIYKKKKYIRVVYEDKQGNKYYQTLGRYKRVKLQPKTLS